MAAYKTGALSWVRNIIPHSRKRLWNGYPVLNQELQNHDPFGRHIPVQVMYGSTPPPPRVSCTLHFKGSTGYRLIFCKLGITGKQQSLIKIQGWTLNLNWSDNKVKAKNWNGCFEINSMFQTCDVLKTWFKLLRVKSYRNDVRGNKNYFELVGGSSYWGFELSGVNCNSK